ncbi:Uncharacterised protein [Klebsiella pneumoniae]|nr:Uncharacterised protein [Raoultella planticola]SSL05727.1 Uncharacterised protein [Klebsiella pneumoniae]SVM98353.1 Uncharacterised protein [Klebsiella pneumoniae]
MLFHPFLRWLKQLSWIRKRSSRACSIWFRSGLLKIQVNGVEGLNKSRFTDFLVWKKALLKLNTPKNGNITKNGIV